MYGSPIYSRCCGEIWFKAVFASLADHGSRLRGRQRSGFCTGGWSPVALPELSPAAAGAGIQAVHASKRSLQDLHHLLRFKTAADKTRHNLHGKTDMMEELLQPYAQVVQTRLAIRSVDETIARAFSVTGEQHLALQAVLRQCVEFVLAKFPLLLR